jgi:hypothetical protein
MNLIMVQYFRLIGLALVLSVGMGSVGSAESDSTVSNTFNRLAGIDLFGDDLTSMGIKGISLTECEAVCSEDSSCKAYSFIEDKQWCFPKSGPGNKQNNSTVISGVKAEYNFDCSHSFEKNEAEVAYCDFLNLQLKPTNLSDSVENQSIEKSLAMKVVGLGAHEGYSFFTIEDDEDNLAKQSPLLAVNCDKKRLYHLSNAAKVQNDDVPQQIKFETYHALLSLKCPNEGIEVADFGYYKSFCYSRVYYISNSLMQSCEEAERWAYYNLLDNLFSEMSENSEYVSDVFKDAKAKWVAYSETQCALDGVMVGTPAIFQCHASSAAEYYSKTITWLVDMGEYEFELKALNINTNNMN